MKRLLFSLLLSVGAMTAQAQAPQGIPYQAAARNANGNIMANQAISVRFTIHDSTANGTAVYQETHSTTTNAQGMFTLNMGMGNPTAGSFAGINWGGNAKFMQVELSTNGGSNYTDMGTQKMMSVPYALYAKRAASVDGISISSISNSGDTLNLSNGQIFVSNINSGMNSISLPTVSTNLVTNITSNSATYGGNISGVSGNKIIERGIVFSQSTNPTIFSSKIAIGNGVGSFDTTIGLNYTFPSYTLNPNTTYYVRAYAINENNIANYGNQVSFTTLSIGQIGTGGGIVFFNKGNSSGGWQYLEAAISDQNSSIDWGCSSIDILGTQSVIGSGETNTSLIVANCNQTSYAAKLCYDLILGGQNDWYLPSKDELYIMVKNLHYSGLGNFSIPSRYWSSTDYTLFFPGLGGVASTCEIDFYTNSSNVYVESSNLTKSYNAKVRAIRAF